MINNWKPADVFSPKPMPTVDLACYHCHQITRQTIKHVTDQQTDYWKGRYERLMASLNDMLKRCTREHGDDAVRLWMERDLIRLRDSFDTEGEEWKKR